jgi:hypothetical protein
MLHLQTSNQSPETFHFGILVVVLAIALTEIAAIYDFMYLHAYPPRMI